MLYTNIRIDSSPPLQVILLARTEPVIGYIYMRMYLSVLSDIEDPVVAEAHHGDASGRVLSLCLRLGN